MTELPKSVAEAKVLGSNKYYTGVPCKHGHLTYRYTKDRICATCAYIKMKKNSAGKGSARWAALSSDKKDEIYKKRKIYYAQTIEVRREEKRKSYNKYRDIPEYRIAKRKYVNERRKLIGRPTEVRNPEVSRRYRQSAKGKALRSKYEVIRRTGIKQATPAWVNMQDIADVYMEAAYMQMQVDHIVPLRNPLVCGLHVWDNLQLMGAIANNRKGNRYWPDMPA